MELKKWLRAYASFSRKDRIGIVVLLAVVAACYGLPLLWPPPAAVPVALAISTALRDSAFGTEPHNRYVSRPAASPDRSPTPPTELFPFDPNTLPASGWRRLGLPERTVRTLEKYRSKGGRFRRPEDLQKIWGLPPGFYDRVQAYIIIAQNKDRSFSPPAFQPERATYKPAAIEINTADSAAWEALPGIGPRLAARILNFRSRLGGFYSVEQVAETYGLPDSTFQRVRPLLLAGGQGVKSINLNTATRDELRLHPYIRSALAGAILAYRQQHGPFKSIDDLRSIHLVDEALFQKLRPYVTVE